MNDSALSGVSFDEQDANLFIVEDVCLRADALKHSILPRLRVVMNSAVSLVHEIYGIEPLDDSIVSVYPNFRSKRDRELTVRYEEVFVGLGGQRKDKWLGFRRKDDKPVQILPFRLAFVLDGSGLSIWLQNGWLKGIDRLSSEKLLRFHVENEEKITPLLFKSHVSPQLGWSEDIPMLAPLRDHYSYMIDEGIFDNCFLGQRYSFPVEKLLLRELVADFACLFPVYDSYIQMAKGLPHRLDVLIDKLSGWLQQDVEAPASDSTASGDDFLRAAKAAETRTKVMPALRWRVFQRDQWKCVACGRSSHDGAVLHVDHIVPRSLGGLDSLANYQTLCDVCNIGKSNRDATDLRRGS